MSVYSGSSIADCGPVNPMTGLFKHFGQDRSLEQIQYAFENSGHSSKAGFRTRKKITNSCDPDHETNFSSCEEFFTDKSSRPEIDAFQFNAFRYEVGLIQQKQQQVNNWAADFAQFNGPLQIHEKPLQGSDSWSHEFATLQSYHHTAFHRSTLFRKDSFTVANHHVPEDIHWEREFSKAETSSTPVHTIENTSNIHIDQPLLKPEPQHTKTTTTTATTNTDRRVIGHPTSAIPLNLSNPELYHTSNPNHINYKFPPHIPHDASKDDVLRTLESKAQRDPLTNADAWRQLGLYQQENEQDDQAICALRQAVRINPALLDVWLALAVSFTNKHCLADAYDALEQWIHHNERYSHLTFTAAAGSNRHASMVQLFLEAARMGDEMDADVQVALGVLFIISEEYNKAVDCFRAAVTDRPHDYVLWNKLGASLAHRGDTESAIEAYFHALKINSTYIRARYNLAISCIRLGHQREAAEHLLTALVIREDSSSSLANQVDTIRDNVWGTLRTLMSNMGRDDLVIQCDIQNVAAFHAEFEF